MVGGNGGSDGLTHRGVVLYICSVFVPLQRLGGRPRCPFASLGLRSPVLSLVALVALVLFGLMRWTEMTDRDHNTDRRRDEGVVADHFPRSKGGMKSQVQGTRFVDVSMC